MKGDSNYCLVNGHTCIKGEFLCVSVLSLLPPACPP